jgi:hypothetical protein
LPKGNKPADGDFEQAKQRVTTKLMPLDYVSGVGSAGSKELRVLLARPLNAQENEHVRTVMQQEAKGHAFVLEQTGKFTKR